jgi:hypothetical protein
LEAAASNTQTLGLEWPGRAGDAAPLSTTPIPIGYQLAARVAVILLITIYRNDFLALA